MSRVIYDSSKAEWVKTIDEETGEVTGWTTDQGEALTWECPLSYMEWQIWLNSTEAKFVGQRPRKPH